MEVTRQEARRKGTVMGTRLKGISLLEGTVDDHGKGFLWLQVFG